MDDAAPDLVEAAKTLIQNMCAGNDETAKALDLSFAAQVSTWLCWGVFVGLFCRNSKTGKRAWLWNRMVVDRVHEVSLGWCVAVD